MKIIVIFCSNMLFMYIFMQHFFSSLEKSCFRLQWMGREFLIFKMYNLSLFMSTDIGLRFWMLYDQNIIYMSWIWALLIMLWCIICMKYPFFFIAVQDERKIFPWFQTFVTKEKPNCARYRHWFFFFFFKFYFQVKNFF